MITKNLHRFFNTILIGCSLLAIGLWGCNDDEVNGFLSFPEDNLLLKAAGDEVIVDVTAGSDWLAESMADWCTVEKNDEGKLVIRVAPSDDIYERGTAVKVTCANNVVRLSIRQEPMSFEILEDKKALSFEKGANTDILKIRTNLNWKVEISDDTWLQVVDTIGTGDVDLTFTTTDNSQNAERATTVRLRYGVRSIKFTATQKGGIRLDGHIAKHYGERELNNGYNLIFLGEGFTQKDLIEGTGSFDMAVEEALTALWNTEPYKTYKEYFNVYSIATQSKEGGITKDGEEAKSTTFGITYKEVDGTPQLEMTSTSINKAWDYASTILSMNKDVLDNNTSIVILVNEDVYAGQTYLWENNYRSLSIVPLNQDTQLPGGFTNIFLHEVGGHGIGKLADEWSIEGNELTASAKTELNTQRNRLYYQNLLLPNTSALISYPQYVYPSTFYKEPYLEYIGCHDGGAGYITSKSNMRMAICHSEERSCMLNNQPYFSLMCRWGIVEHLMFRLGVYEYSSAGLNELYKHFLKNDSFTVPEAPVLSNRPQLPQPIFIAQ